MNHRRVNVGLLVAAILVGTLVLVGAILFVVFSAVRKAAQREAAELASEGVVLDSGSVTLTASFKNFRGPSVYIGVGSRTGQSRIVLTKRRLVFVPSGRNRFGFARMDYEQLPRFEVGLSDGQLHLHSDQPPNGSGTINLHLSVTDPASWVRALTEAGARLSTGQPGM